MPAAPLRSPYMRKVISISQTVVHVYAENGRCEVWASGNAKYDETHARLEVKLDSFLRRSWDDKRARADWLPNSQTVMSTASFEEGTSIAKEIFNNWLRRVRQAVASKDFQNHSDIATAEGLEVTLCWWPSHQSKLSKKKAHGTGLFTMKRTVLVYHFHNSNANSGLGAWPEGYELLNQLRGYPHPPDLRAKPRRPGEFTRSAARQVSWRDSFHFRSEKRRPIHEHDQRSEGGGKEVDAGVDGVVQSNDPY